MRSDLPVQIHNNQNTFPHHTLGEWIGGLYNTTIANDPAYSFVMTYSWQIKPQTMPEVAAVLQARCAAGQWYAKTESFYGMYKDGPVLVFIGVNIRNSLQLRLAAPTIEHLRNYLADLEREFPPYTDPPKDQISVHFWYTTVQDGPEKRSRDLDAPLWAEVESNYPVEVREALEKLLDYQPHASGRVILWHGEPGTGKTWALRSLMREWAPWAEAHYITDPEKFFGGDVDYMMQVCTESAVPTSYDEDTGQPVFGKDSKWRVLILEDCGELLSKDAKQRVGQGLSRFLNIVDGMIGQGLRVLIIVTTNEDLGQLHPAVTRPGRCVMIQKFGKLNQDEVFAWLSEHLDEGETCPVPEKSMTLAELYAHFEGRAIPEPERRAAGFLA